MKNIGGNGKKLNWFERVEWKGGEGGDIKINEV